jgi:dTDP-4-amino-4,6-dideoxygalactose transaminase
MRPLKVAAAVDTRTQFRKAAAIARDVARHDITCPEPAIGEVNVSCMAVDHSTVRTAAFYVRVSRLQYDFPATKRAAQEVLSLPMFPELSGKERERVVKGVRSFMLSRKGCNYA